MKTRSVHRMLWTTVKPNSESHCRPWWRDLKRIKNGCTGFLARRWYVCLITWILFDPHASFRSCVSPTLVWQLQLANHSRSQSLLGHSGRTCTELAWMGQTLYSTPPLSSWLTWMEIWAAMDLMTQHSMSTCFCSHGGRVCMFRLAFHPISVRQQSSQHSTVIWDLSDELNKPAYTWHSSVNDDLPNDCTWCRLLRFLCSLTLMTSLYVCFFMMSLIASYA